MDRTFLISPYKLSPNDCFMDEDGDCYKVIKKSPANGRVALMLENAKGEQFNSSYEHNDYIRIINEDKFKAIQYADSIRTHVIYLVPKFSRSLNDIKFLQPDGKFKYNQQTAKLFNMNEAKSILFNLNKSRKEGVYLYGIR